MGVKRSAPNCYTNNTQQWLEENLSDRDCLNLQPGLPSSIVHLVSCSKQEILAGN